MKYKNAPHGWHSPSRLVTVKAMRPKFRIWNMVHLFFDGSCYVHEEWHYPVKVTYFGINYHAWQDYKRPQGISEFSRSEKHMLHMNKMRTRETIKRRAYLRVIAISCAESQRLAQKQADEAEVKTREHSC